MTRINMATLRQAWLDLKARIIAAPCAPTACGARPELGSGETGYEVIKHLVGKAGGGSGDLSTNPEHLARYGR
jgi:hypothetical protein